MALLDSQDCQNSRISSFNSYSLCAEIIGEICKCAEQQQHLKSDSLILKARSLIHEQQQERFSLKELSSSLGVCPEHLCRVFQRHLNSTPKHYHDQLRIESICGRLVGSNKSIKEIAEEFGFDDPSNFNKFFKKHCSATPAQFRNNNALLLYNMFND